MIESTPNADNKSRDQVYLKKIPIFINTFDQKEIKEEVLKLVKLAICNEDSMSICFSVTHQIKPKSRESIAIPVEISEAMQIIKKIHEHKGSPLTYTETFQLAMITSGIGKKLDSIRTILSGSKQPIQYSIDMLVKTEVDVVHPLTAEVKKGPRIQTHDTFTSSNNELLEMVLNPNSTLCKITRRQFMFSEQEYVLEADLFAGLFNFKPHTPELYLYELLEEIDIVLNQNFGIAKEIDLIPISFAEMKKDLLISNEQITDYIKEHMYRKSSLNIYVKKLGNFVNQSTKSIQRLEYRLSSTFHTFSYLHFLEERKSINQLSLSLQLLAFNYSDEKPLPVSRLALASLEQLENIKHLLIEDLIYRLCIIIQNDLVETGVRAEEGVTQRVEASTKILLKLLIDGNKLEQAIGILDQQKKKKQQISIFEFANQTLGFVLPDKK